MKQCHACMSHLSRVTCRCDIRRWSATWIGLALTSFTTVGVALAVLGMAEVVITDALQRRRATICGRLRQRTDSRLIRETRCGTPAGPLALSTATGGNSDPGKRQYFGL